MIYDWFTANFSRAAKASGEHERMTDNAPGAFGTTDMTDLAYLPQAFDSRDPRADGRSRRVSLARDHILIARRMAGIDMRLRVPVAAYLGAALSVETKCDGSVFFRLTLVHADAELSAILLETDDDSEIVALWRSCARDLGLAALVETEPGRFERAESARHPPRRRRNVALTRRRPRFLTRRRAGDQARAGTVHREEREILCYE